MKDLDYEKNEAAPEDLKRLVESADQKNAVASPASAPAQPQRTARRRYALFVAILFLFGLIAGVAIWKWNSVLTKVEKGAAPDTTSQPADLVIANEEQLRQISVEKVGERAITIDRDTTGKVSFNEDRLTPVFTPYAGRAIEVSANRGADVRQGQPLLVLESPDLVAAHNDLASARSDLAKAKIGLDVATTAAERARRLHEQEALATKDLQQAEADLARAQDEYKRAQAALTIVENRLALFGKDMKEIEQLGSSVDRRVVIKAPIAGTIVDRKVGPGQYVKPDSPDPLFLISDLSTLWVFADVYESDLAGIRLDAPVTISVAAYPGRAFPARVSFISPTVDPTTRTVRVRCLVQNPDRLLKPDMFAKIKIGSVKQQSMAIVPASAVVSEGNGSLVFIEESPGRFRRRQVKVGHETNGYVVVDSGLQPGERVVTRGGLLLNELNRSQG